MKTIVLSILTIVLIWNFEPESIMKTEKFPNYKRGLLQSKNEMKPLLILFTGNNCVNNLATKEIITTSVEVQKLLADKFIFKEFKVDDNTKLNENEQYQSKRINSEINTIGKRSIDLEISKFGKRIQPYFVILDYNERIIDDSEYISTENELKKFLKKGINNF